jgi:hypothetical protein
MCGYFCPAIFGCVAHYTPRPAKSEVHFCGADNDNSLSARIEPTKVGFAGVGAAYVV